MDSTLRDGLAGSDEKVAELPELVLLELAVVREATALEAAVLRDEGVHEHRRAILSLRLLDGCDLRLVETLRDLASVPAGTLLRLREVDLDALCHDGLSFLWTLGQRFQPRRLLSLPIEGLAR